MNSKNSQLGKFANNVFVLLSSFFISVWTNILANWVSDVLGRFFKIETSAGTWSVVAAVIATAVMSLILKWKTDPNNRSNNPKESESNSKNYLMQGGMISLGIALNQVCNGIFSGPWTDGKILPLVMALIPALEGALGSQFIQIKNNQALYYLDTAIRELVSGNSRVSERMIVDRAIILAKKDTVNPIASMSTRDVSELTRAHMVHLAVNGELNKYFGKGQTISIDSTQDPNQWRIEKKMVTPVQPVGAQSSNSSQTATEKQVEAQKLEMQKIEKFQREAWKEWKANFYNHKALDILLQEALHTKHGLSPSIKAEITERLNHILMAVVKEKRVMTKGEYEKISILNKILGHQDI
jgi:hypothetical protein